MFQTTVVEKIKHIFCVHLIFSFENRAVYYVVWRNIYFSAGQATENNMARTHCMLDN